MIEISHALAILRAFALAIAPFHWSSPAHILNREMVDSFELIIFKSTRLTTR
uniref:Uncharacterized protein n=1 Tax=Helianthus annuus TaxID=4232 RepID=A0A251UGB4_HELAN